MKYIADLHIHSPFSRATSKTSNLVGLAAWARIKGIHVLGTGDFTHPGWFRQIKEQLEPAEPGFLRLKKELRPAVGEVLVPFNLDQGAFAVEAGNGRFVLTAEISSIYKRHGRVRKVHNILFVPDLESAARINARLASIGNIESDGRPILGLDSRNLLEILLEQAPDGFLVPAHIWTPWFSLFGSKSGFDSIEECFDDLSSHIFALETGLSSDPDMNRLVSALDRFTLISNSDCHSPAKLGREANLFNTDFHFHAMRDALKDPTTGAFLGTIEFYPEEGKYHFDGHRKCNICFQPAETRRHKSICPVCGRPLTIGVSHRVMELADRTEPRYPAGYPAFRSIIPLPEVLGEILGSGPATKRVMTQYARLIALFGSEFELLLDTPVDEIEKRYSPLLAEAVQRIRIDRVIKQPGFDGEFGVIKVFAEGEIRSLQGQGRLFAVNKPQQETSVAPTAAPDLFANLQPATREVGKAEFGLNSEQAIAVNSEADHLIITAGPGTGKTHTLIARLVRLLTRKDADSGKIVAITFTNRAADEIRDRLHTRAGIDAEPVFIGTFHGFCLHWLRRANPELAVAGREARGRILNKLYPGLTASEEKSLQEQISHYFEAMISDEGGARESKVDEELIANYCAQLRRHNCIDLEEVLPYFVRQLNDGSDLRPTVLSAVRFLFIDEFQDLNYTQYQLVRTLAAAAQIFAIGDPDQAIYGFRGSSPEFFFRFIEEFKAETLFLTRNYRTAPVILEAARAVISHNPSTMRQPLVAMHQQESAIEYHLAASPLAEAEFIVQRIEEALGGISHFSINSGRGGEHSHQGTGLAFGDIAIFYRLTQQAAALCQALERRGIPFQVVDMAPFYMQPKLRAAYYWLRVAAGHGDNGEHLALLQNIRGLGPTTIKQLEDELLFSNRNFFDAVSRMELAPKARGIIGELHVFIGLFSNKVEKLGLAAALLEVFDWLAISNDLPAAQRLLDLAGSFGSDLRGFSEYLKRNSQATVYDDTAEAVSLMTIHAAKGLEFPLVFITGVEEDILPCRILADRSRAADTPDDEVAEERRLFYVGMTRAKDSLILTAAANRNLFGERRQQRLSCFVNEISPHLLKKAKQPVRARKKRPTAVQMKLF
jgi:DNA helicase-2/ATP-dependent DNA helicase PcrA